MPISLTGRDGGWLNGEIGDDGMVKCWDGGVAEWLNGEIRDGGMVKCWDGGVAEWLNGEMVGWIAGWWDSLKMGWGSLDSGIAHF